MSETTGTDKLIQKAAYDVITLARNTLIVNLRFLDLALAKLAPVADDDATMAVDGVRLIYGPKHILRSFRDEQERPARDYLHAVLHCVFSHMFVGRDIDRRLWDLASDIAAESIINELGLKVTASPRETAQMVEIRKLKDELSALTAEKIYHYYKEADLSGDLIARLSELFRADDHSVWYRYPDESDRNNSRRSGSERRGESSEDASVDQSDKEFPKPFDEGEDKGSFNMPVPEELQTEWRKIAEKIQEDLETFSKKHGDSAGGMMQNLSAVNRERYDYTTFLRKFSVLGENAVVSDEEFDYIYYTYGLRLYDRMPLVEPLEYKEVKRVREFVIAIDTSGSTSGEVVQRFVQKTFNILMSSESFFSRVNIHIIQCDASIQEHVRITSQEEFEKYIRDMEILGLGGTDFRPVFELVDELIEAREFTDLRGLIYFTDGYGTFPVKKPDYNTAFVFLDNDYNNPDVPPWAIKLVLQDDEI